MTGIKPLPSWIHQHLKEMDNQYGAVNTFRKRAKLDHNTFKRLVEKGYGQPNVVLRVVYAVEADKAPGEITAQIIKAAVNKRRSEILSAILGNAINDAIPTQLQAWMMYERKMKRPDIAAELGYKAVSNVNSAVDIIRRELDINRPFMKLVFEIEEEIERMSKG